MRRRGRRRRRVRKRGRRRRRRVRRGRGRTRRRRRRTGSRRRRRRRGTRRRERRRKINKTKNSTEKTKIHIKIQQKLSKTREVLRRNFIPRSARMRKGEARKRRENPVTFDLSNVR